MKLLVFLLILSCAFASGGVLYMGAYPNIVAAIQQVRQGTKSQKVG